MRRNYHTKRHCPPAPIHLLALRHWRDGDRHVLQLPFQIEPLTQGPRKQVLYAQRQRAQTMLFLTCMMSKPLLPSRIHLVRIAPKKLDIDDELPQSLLAVRAGVSDWLGEADRITFTYGQHAAGVRDYGARIEVLLG